MDQVDEIRPAPTTVNNDRDHVDHPDPDPDAPGAAEAPAMEARPPPPPPEPEPQVELPQDENQDQEQQQQTDLAEYALQIVVAAVFAYLFSRYESGKTPAAAAGFTTTEQFTQTIDGEVYIITAFKSTPKGSNTALSTVLSTAQNVFTSIFWIFPFLLVVFSTPRIFSSTGRLLRQRLAHSSNILSRATRSDTLAAVLQAIVVGFVASSSCSFLMGYRYDQSDCHAGGRGRTRTYLPMRSREDVKVFLRAWGTLLQQFGSIAAGIARFDGSSFSGMQYAVVGVTVVAVCTWDLLSSPCYANVVLKMVTLCSLVACECVWVWGKMAELLRRDRLACRHLLWHLSVILVVLYAPV